jgi:hypothetical protein
MGRSGLSGAVAAILLGLFLAMPAGACGTAGIVGFFLDSLWLPDGTYALGIERELLRLQLRSEAGDGELTLKLLPQDALVLAEQGPADQSHRQRVAGLVALQSYPLAEGVVRRTGDDALFARLVFSVLSPGEVFQAVLARRYALYDRKVVRDWKPGSKDYLSTLSLELAVPDQGGRPCFLGAILETYRLGDSYRRIALFQVLDARTPAN